MRTSTETYEHAINGLLQKRREIMGEMAVTRERLGVLANDVEAIDRVLERLGHRGMLEAAPQLPRHVIFYRGQLRQWLLTQLREHGPATSRALADRLAQFNESDSRDKRLMDDLVSRVGKALNHASRPSRYRHAKQKTEREPLEGQSIMGLCGSSPATRAPRWRRRLLTQQWFCYRKAFLNLFTTRNGQLKGRRLANLRWCRDFWRLLSGLRLRCRRRLNDVETCYDAEVWASQQIVKSHNLDARPNAARQFNVFPRGGFRLHIFCRCVQTNKDSHLGVFAVNSAFQFAHHSRINILAGFDRYDGSPIVFSAAHKDNFAIDSAIRPLTARPSADSTNCPQLELIRLKSGEFSCGQFVFRNTVNLISRMWKPRLKTIFDDLNCKIGNIDSDPTAAAFFCGVNCGATSTKWIKNNVAFIARFKIILSSNCSGFCVG